LYILGVIGKKLDLNHEARRVNKYSFHLCPPFVLLEFLLDDVNSRILAFNDFEVQGQGKYIEFNAGDLECLMRIHIMTGIVLADEWMKNNINLVFGVYIARPSNIKISPEAGYDSHHIRRVCHPGTDG